MINECKSIDDIRSNIDRLDREIITLLAERSLYVKEAARFKKDKEAVKAPDRVKQVLDKVSALAGERGLNPAIAREVYRTMIDCFINFEMKEHERLAD